MSNEPSNSGGNPTPCCLSKGNAAPGAKGNFAPCTLQTNAESPRCPRCGCANATGTVAPGEGADSSYFEALIKYIPGELVAAYLALDGILRETLSDKLFIDPMWLYWGVFGALFILTPLYVIYRPTHNDFTNHSVRFHAAAATVAFAVWVFALGGPFAITWPDLYRPVFGSLVLIITTLTLPVVEKIAHKLPFFAVDRNRRCGPRQRGQNNR
jgi:hypothetical protein